MSRENKALFVMVGTSALSARRLGDGFVPGACHLRQRCADYAEDADRWSAIRDELFAEVLRAHQEYWRKKRADSPMEGTSAEMTSTSLLMRDPDGLPGGAEDRSLLGSFEAASDKVVLLASDTTAGKFCAELNARLMCEFLVGCGCGRGCETCVVEVVDGLEARDAQFRGVADVLPGIVKKYEDGKRTLYFNITGGYKGAIPAITYYCWDHRPSIDMFNQHVSHGEVVKLAFKPKSGGQKVEFQETRVYGPRA